MIGSFWARKYVNTRMGWLDRPKNSQTACYLSICEWRKMRGAEFEPAYHYEEIEFFKSLTSHFFLLQLLTPGIGLKD